MRATDERGQQWPWWPSATPDVVRIVSLVIQLLLARHSHLSFHLSFHFHFVCTSRQGKPRPRIRDDQICNRPRIRSTSTPCCVRMSALSALSAGFCRYTIPFFGFTIHTPLRHLHVHATAVFPPLPEGLGPTRVKYDFRRRRRTSLGYNQPIEQLQQHLLTNCVQTPMKALHIEFTPNT